MEIKVMEKVYPFPQLSDPGFERLSGEIERIKAAIKTGTRPSRLFSFVVKEPKLDAEKALALVDELISNYETMIEALKGKLAECRSCFAALGDGIRASFQEKVEELGRLDAKRARIVQEMRTRGDASILQDMEGEEARIRANAMILTNAVVLILKKLSYALQALELLANDERTQRGVLEDIRKSQSTMKDVLDYKRSMAKIEREIAEVASLAQKLDRLIISKLDPLGVLLDSAGRIDESLGKSLLEIEKISRRLEEGTSASAFGSALSSGTLALLVSARIKADAIERIFQSMTTDDAAAQFDSELAMAGAADFAALSANMGDLVDRSLRDLRNGGAEAPRSGARPQPRAEPKPAAPGAGRAPGTGEARAGSRAEAGNQARVRPAPAPGNYRRIVSPDNPTLVLFLLDRSASMGEDYSAGLSKAEFLARSVDEAIATLAARSMQRGQVEDFFDIACLGFGGDKVADALPLPNGGASWLPMSEVVRASRAVRPDGGAAKPAWIRPVSEGETPLKAAFTKARAVVAEWCRSHQASYPPTVLCVTDGNSTDGDFSDEALRLSELCTADGPTLLFNLHVDSSGGRESLFPAEPDGLDALGRKLFELSSFLPPKIADSARASGLRIDEDARFFAYRAGAATAARFFSLGMSPLLLQ